MKLASLLSWPVLFATIGLVASVGVAVFYDGSVTERVIIIGLVGTAVTTAESRVKASQTGTKADAAAEKAAVAATAAGVAAEKLDLNTAVTVAAAEKVGVTRRDVAKAQESIEESGSPRP